MQHEPDPPDTELVAAIELFFRKPHAQPIEGWVSTLFLCRKELQDCLIGKVVNEAEVLTHEHHRLFATAMVTFSGIELLASLAPSSGFPGRRGLFVEFVKQYSQRAEFPVTADEAEVLWNFRNALSHTFGLYHVDQRGQVVPLWLYDQNGPAPVVRKQGPGWEVCIDSLVELFLYLVGAFRAHVETDVALQKTFLSAFRKYGTIHMRGPHIVRGEW